MSEMCFAGDVNERKPKGKSKGKAFSRHPGVPTLQDDDTFNFAEAPGCHSRLKQHKQIVLLKSYEMLAELPKAS